MPIFLSVTRIGSEETRQFSIYNTNWDGTSIPDLVEEKGRLEKIGRPKIYGTTDIFLRNFGLKSLKDLPMIDFELLEE